MEQLLITRREAAEALSISVDTLDDLRRTGKLTGVTIFSRVYFTPEALREFVEERKEKFSC